MAFHVCLKVGGLGKGLSADAAGVGFFPSMCTQVALEVCLLGKALATHLAAKRLFSRVGHGVTAQGRRQKKHLPAHATVKLRAGMGHDVVRQKPWLFLVGACVGA